MDSCQRSDDSKPRVKKERIVDGLDGTSDKSRRFLKILAIVFTTAAIALVAISVYSNHYGDFGEVGQFQTLNDRLVKLEYLEGLPDDELASAWVIGSSNTMPFLPEHVEERFGYKTFNLGVFWGRVEDTWSWLHYLKERRKSVPKMVVLGIEPWTFGAEDSGPPLFRKYRRRLLNAPLLREYLDDYNYPLHQFSKVLDTVSWQNLKVLTKVTLRYKFSRVGRKPLSESTFLTDGSNELYNKREPNNSFLPPEVHQFYLDERPGPGRASEAVESRRGELLSRGLIPAEDVTRYLPNDRMTGEALQLFERVIALCDESGIQVGLIILPVHPYFYDVLSARTDHQKHLQRLNEFVAELRAKYPAIRGFVDASHIDRFGGSPFEFHDRLHMTPDNTALVLDQLRENWDKTDS